MRAQARYWILFVIVAVGLALSWGQVGRKTQRAMESEPVVYLVTEQPCRPVVSPCAATGTDRALVLGPDRGGMRIRQTGIHFGDIVRVEVTLLGQQGQDLGSRILQPVDQTWPVTEIPSSARALRVRLVGNRELTLAEFPL